LAEHSFNQVYPIIKGGSKASRSINDADMDAQVKQPSNNDLENLNFDVKNELEESDKRLKMEKEITAENTEAKNIMATGATGLNLNCIQCGAIFIDRAKRAAFGYQIENALPECHDICVEDVRDICVKHRTLRHCIPCGTSGSAGCRGGFLPDGPPTVQNFRVLCAAEYLSPASGCDRIINEIEFEIVLRFGSTLVVVTPKDRIECFWYEFAKFPTGVFYTNNQAGYDNFKNELLIIDGSCKVIIIEQVRVTTEGNDCILVIEYKIVDKLWKHENLLVTAIKPYYDRNITVKEEFAQGHKIAECSGSGPCGGIDTPV
jgi:hypothetical protein